MDNVFYLTKVGTDADTGAEIQERRNGYGARVYGANIDYKIAHGREAQLQLGFTVQRSQYTEAVSWSEDQDVDPIKCMPRTPDYYGYFTFTSAPLKNFDFLFLVCTRERWWFLILLVILKRPSGAYTQFHGTEPEAELYVCTE